MSRWRRSGHYACLPQRADSLLHVGKGRLTGDVIRRHNGGSRLFDGLASLQLLEDERSSIVEIQCPAKVLNIRPRRLYDIQAAHPTEHKVFIHLHFTHHHLLLQFGSEIFSKKDGSEQPDAAILVLKSNSTF